MPQLKERREDTTSVSEEKISPVVELANEMYKNIGMGSDAILHLLPRINEKSGNAASMKTDMSASLCFYEKINGRIKEILRAHQAEAKQENLMTRTMAHAGIVMNTAMDASDSHIAEMLIEGSTMAITQMTRLTHQFESRPACEELIGIAREVITFEEGQIERLKAYL